MTDPFGRTISYLRVSVTDRCDLRCFYCMSEDMTFLPKADLLTLEELDRLCSTFVRLGTRKIRITGGEPLVRRGVMTLFRSLSRHIGAGGLDELTVTTNGSVRSPCTISKGCKQFPASRRIISSSTPPDILRYFDGLERDRAGLGPPESA